MNNKYSLPKDGGLIEVSAPRDIIHRYEKIHTTVYENEYLGVQYVADTIVKAIRTYNEIHCSNEVYEESQPFVLGLTTGRTPLGLYRELVKRHEEGIVSFRNVAVFSLDEFYPIRSTEQQSRNFRIHEDFLNHIDILPENIHIPDGTVPEARISEYCASYDHSVRKIDLMIIGVGEDGPTHQPVEQLIALRSIPNMKVYRPADGKETAAAWISALTGTAPTVLVLTRQALPQYENSGLQALKGGYVLEDCEGTPDVLLIGTGSEVELCVEAKAKLAESGVKARVVSMPCIEEFEKQTGEYKESVLPAAVKARVCVEAGSPYSWYKYAGEKGEIVGMSTFGASAPAPQLFEKFGFTAANVVEKAKASLAKIK